MPLITVKMWPGRSEAQKRAAAKSLLDAAVQSLGVPESAFTIIVEDIPKEEWESRVVKVDIEPKQELVMIREGKSTET